MAVSGNAKQSFDMKIIDGNLVVGKYAHRIGVVTDVDMAVQQLLDGKLVFVHAYANTIDLVTKTVRMALGQCPADQSGQVPNGKTPPTDQP